MDRNPVNDLLGGFDIRRLNIDSPNAELFIPQRSLESIRSIVLNQERVAFDLTDQVCFVATRVKVSMSYLSIIVLAYSIVTLAHMYGDMYVLG